MSACVSLSLRHFIISELEWDAELCFTSRLEIQELWMGLRILLHHSLRTSLNNYWIMLDPFGHLSLKK